MENCQPQSSKIENLFQLMKGEDSLSIFILKYKYWIYKEGVPFQIVVSWLHIVTIISVIIMFSYFLITLKLCTMMLWSFLLAVQCVPMNQCMDILSADQDQLDCLTWWLVSNGQC